LNNSSRIYAIIAVVLSLLFIIWSVTLIRSVKVQRDDVSNHVAAITQIGAVNHAILELQTVYLEDKYRTNSNWVSGLETYTKTVNNFQRTEQYHTGVGGLYLCIGLHRAQGGGYSYIHLQW
jgi:hypothetical protein